MNDRQFAQATLQIGKALRMHAEANLTTKGILGVGFLVSGILLATAVLVATAIREGRKAKAEEFQRKLPRG